MEYNCWLIHEHLICNETDRKRRMSCYFRGHFMNGNYNNEEIGINKKEWLHNHKQLTHCLSNKQKK